MVDYYSLSVETGATFGAVFLGFFLSVRYEKRKQRKLDKKAKKETLASIKEELESNRSSVKDTIDLLKQIEQILKSVNEPLDSKTLIPYQFILLRRSALDSAISSGTIRLLSLKLQNKLLFVYEILDSYRRFLRNLEEKFFLLDFKSLL